MKIEVFGADGCKKCSNLKNKIEDIVNELKLEDVTVEKVTDTVKMVNKGIMSTPAVAFDGEVKFTGKVPSTEEINEMLK